MANEQLIQHGYLSPEGFQGRKEGKFEVFKLGDTNISALKQLGIRVETNPFGGYKFTAYRVPKNLLSLKPDTIYTLRSAGKKGILNVVAVVESKAPKKFLSDKEAIRARAGVSVSRSLRMQAGRGNQRNGLHLH